MDSIRFRNQVIPFVILMQGRTGSTYLQQALNRHPRVRALGEELIKLRSKGAEGQLEWTRDYLTAPLVGRYGAIGFKTKVGDILDMQAFAHLLQEKQARIVLLRRRNSVKLVTSWIRGAQLEITTGNFNLFQESDRPEPFRIEPDDFGQKLEQVEREYHDVEQYAQSLSLPLLELFYEELLADAGSFVGRTCDFLQVERLELRGGTLKNTSDDLKQSILNFDELRLRYVGTRFEVMFDQVMDKTGE